MDRKNIWIICQYAGSPYHGMNYRPYYLGRELVKSGHDVTIFSGSFSHQFYNLPEVQGKYNFENIDGINYCWIKTPVYPESRSYGRVWSWLVFVKALYGLNKLHLDPPDAIIVSSPSPYPVLPAARLAKKYSAKLVFEVRDIWPLSLVELGGISTRHPFIMMTQWVEDFAYKKADKVVSLLPCALEHMERRGLDPEKYTVIPNGVVISGEPANASPPDIRSVLGGRKFVVGYTGTIGLANALDTFISAASLLKDNKDIGFAIVGDGAELAKLKEYASTLNLDNLVFIPAVSKEVVPLVLSRLDACYLGLKAEPLFRFGISPTKLFDYMIAAKPVIMAIDSCNDIVTESGCGITVKPEDPEELAVKIKELADTTESTRKTMGLAGKNYIEKNHLWKVLVQKYLDVLLYA